MFKIAHHIKNKRNLNLGENRQSTNINSKMTQMLELLEWDYKATSENNCPRSNVDALKTNDKNRISQQRHKTYKEKSNWNFRTECNNSSVYISLDGSKRDEH